MQDIASSRQSFFGVSAHESHAAHMALHAYNKLSGM
jgi:hypothetical protein